MMLNQLVLISIKVGTGGLRIENFQCNCYTALMLPITQVIMRVTSSTRIIIKPYGGV